MSFKSILLVFVLAMLIIPLSFYCFISMYSSGVPEMTLPDMTGLASSEAISMMQTLNLVPRIVGGIYDKNVPDGRVASQRPEPGRKVKEGRVVNIILSKGERTVIVPNLVGRDFDGAKEYLSQLGLTIGSVSASIDNNTGDNIIVSQSLSPETEVRLHSPMDLIVNQIAKGPDEQ